MSYCVYKHTTPSGKCYIGITSNCERRWNNGLGYKGQPHFYNAIQKYGWENIEHKILVDGLTLEEAKTAERYNIRRYKSNDNKYGYNETPGGDLRKGSRHVPVICISTGEAYGTIAEASRETGISEQSIVNCCKGKSKSAGNRRWAYMPYKPKKIRIAFGDRVMYLNEF